MNYRLTLILIWLLLGTSLNNCLSTRVLAQTQTFTGILQHSDAELRQVTETGWAAFQAAKDRQRAEGYRLIDLETAKNGGEDRQFTGIFTKSPLVDSIGVADSWSGFIKLKRKMARAEYTMIDVAAVSLNESDANFYGVWVKEEKPTLHKVWLLDSHDIIRRKTRDMAKDRFKIKRVHVLDVPNGEPSFVVLYHFSPIDRYNFLYFPESLDAFAAELAERRESKVQLIDFDRYREGNRTRYVAVFQDGDYDAEFVTGLPLDELRARAANLEAERGLKLVNLSVD